MIVIMKKKSWILKPKWRRLAQMHSEKIMNILVSSMLQNHWVLQVLLFNFPFREESYVCMLPWIELSEEETEPNLDGRSNQKRLSLSWTRRVPLITLVRSSIWSVIFTTIDSSLIPRTSPIYTKCCHGPKC